MTTTATQLPFVDAPATSAGRGLFRKQVLPLGSVTHPKQGEIEFTSDVLEELVKTFDAGAMDQVSFTLVDPGNRHTDDPERHRGEIRRLELGDDGLYAVIDPSPRGRELLAENPRQPVSARITVPEVGDFAGRPVLAHVAATPDPVAKGMKPGEWVDASAQVDELVDLSGESFVPTAEPRSSENVSKDAPSTTGTDAPNFSDEEKGALGKLFQLLGFGKAPADEPLTPEQRANLMPKPDELSDDEVDKILADALKDTPLEPAATEPVATTEPEPVAALSDDDRQTIDMANETAKRMTLKAGRTELSTRLSQYVEDGVPPALVEAAREALKDDESTIIDLANEREPAAAKALFATLDAAKGTLEFTETGTSVIGEDPDAEKRKEWAKAAEEKGAIL